MGRIELTQGHYAEVDDADMVRLSTHRWKVLKSRGNIYAARSNGRTGETILMHRVVVMASDGTHVDHRDGNGLNNRRENLRSATCRQNAANVKKRTSSPTSSRFKGVYWNKEKAKWQASIGGGRTADGRQKVLYLGRYDDEAAAAKAYDARALAIHGEFAVLNFPATVGP